jgi:hypothetical protein
MSPEEREIWESAGADFRNGVFRRARRKIRFAIRRWKRTHGDQKI